MIIINRIPNDLVSEKHICYFTKRESTLSDSTISLYEVVELKLKHPEAPEHAFINDFDVIKIAEEKIGTIEAGDLLLLESTQNLTKRNCDQNKKEEIK